jgi:hypothetical protein
MIAAGAGAVQRDFDSRAGPLPARAVTAGRILLAKPGAPCYILTIFISPSCPSLTGGPKCLLSGTALVKGSR